MIIILIVMSICVIAFFVYRLKKDVKAIKYDVNAIIDTMMSDPYGKRRKKNK